MSSDDDSDDSSKASTASTSLTVASTVVSSQSAVTRLHPDRALHWVFTLYNTNCTEAYERLISSPDVSYAVLGSEVCPTTSRHHLQCYLQLKCSKRLAAMKKIFPKAHWEPARGTPHQNQAYCKKDLNYRELGHCRVLKRGGAETQTTAYAAVISLSKRGCFAELETSHPREFLHRYSTIRAIFKDFQETPPESPWVRGVWIQGPSGAGKSRLARTIYRPHYAKLANKWFDGYTDEPYIIIDDIGPDQAKTLAYHLKIWGDRYPFIAESKNWSRTIAPRGFIITSQYSIRGLWTDDETREALERRYTTIDLGDVPRVDEFRWLQQCGFTTTE